MTTINDKIYRELRCKSCRKMICYEYVFAGRIAFACPRCGEMNEIEFKHLKTADNQATIEKDFQLNSENSKKIKLKGGE